MGCDPSEACFNILPSECVVPQAESEIIVDPQFSVEATEVSVCGTSFADAAANCETNAVCNPLESDCVPGQACFVVPLSNCTAINTTAPTIEALSPAPTAPPPSMYQMLFPDDPLSQMLQQRQQPSQPVQPPR